MIEDIKLCEYSLNYLDAMYLLDRECFAEEFRFDRESMRVFAEESDAIVRVAVIANGEIVGFVIVHVEQTEREKRAYVVTLDVAAKYRRQGLAKWLLQIAEQQAASAGALMIELHVFTGNEVAIRFYERLGYGRVAVRRRFYGKTGLDAFAYRKSLKTL